MVHSHQLFLLPSTGMVVCCNYLYFFSISMAKTLNLLPAKFTSLGEFISSVFFQKAICQVYSMYDTLILDCYYINC